MASPCAAQAPPSAPSTLSPTPSTQTQQALNPATGSQLPVLPSTGATAPVQANPPTPLANQPQSSGKLSPSAGRGLPGMSGGATLNAPMGAGDPAASYMRPQTLGTMACDLLFDPACL